MTVVMLRGLACCGQSQEEEAQPGNNTFALYLAGGISMAIKGEGPSRCNCSYPNLTFKVASQLRGRQMAVPS